MAKRALLGGLLLLGVSTTAFGFGSAWATPPPDHKVTICHATNSATNPYVQITVDVSAAGIHQGHADHTGPLWDPDLKGAHVKWGDIIPTFTYADFSYPGMNVPAGDAWLANGCAEPLNTVTTVPAPTTTSVPPSAGPGQSTVSQAATSGLQEIEGASTVHTGEPWAGAKPYGLTVGVIGCALIALGAWGLLGRPPLVRRRYAVANRAATLTTIVPSDLWVAEPYAAPSNDLWV